jgi:ribosome-associated protein
MKGKQTGYNGTMTFPLENDYIELYKLIKVLDLVDSGGQAKQLIENELVYRNGEVETRKRAKIRAGETIHIGEVAIKVVSA